MVGVLGHYSNRADQGERICELLAVRLSELKTDTIRTSKQVHRRLRPDQVEKVVAGYQAGATLRELGERFSVHRTTVSELLEQRGVERRYASLSPTQVAEGIRLYHTGMSLVAVGKELGVNQSTVWSALKRAGAPLRDCHGRKQSGR